ncbi:hypothetical protein ElyMa_007070700 [Elysia marginata]|uniref:Fibronectin type-III domain-containing protein n=1 Tax=Elysia marginata TaxID=1093978 RepID=A0AAV4JZZ1_9GAST|nr:hypothetical protein ElyMa_007070700 [Elysia marginata]
MFITVSRHWGREISPVYLPEMTAHSHLVIGHPGKMLLYCSHHHKEDATARITVVLVAASAAAVIVVVVVVVVMVVVVVIIIVAVVLLVAIAVITCKCRSSDESIGYGGNIPDNRTRLSLSLGARSAEVKSLRVHTLTLLQKFQVDQVDHSLHIPENGEQDLSCRGNNLVLTWTWSSFVPILHRFVLYILDCRGGPRIRLQSECVAEIPLLLHCNVFTLRFHLYSELTWDPTVRDFSITQYSCDDMVYSLFRNAYFISNFFLFDHSIYSNHAFNFFSMSRVQFGKGPARMLSIT